MVAADVCIMAVRTIRVATAGIMLAAADRAIAAVTIAMRAPATNTAATVAVKSPSLYLANIDLPSSQGAYHG